MSDSFEHIDKEHILSPEEEAMLRQAAPPFRKSKMDVWAELSSKIDKEAAPKEAKIIRIAWVKYAAAAVLIAAVGLGLTMRFYTQDFLCPRGQHLSYTMPDGSTVKLNAESSISLHPYWWRFNRELTFEGEGFFQVEKGSKFTIVSGNGTTEVLGTSFNINTRNGGYAVYCATGKVRVSSGNDETVITPNMQSTLLGNILEVRKNLVSENILGWTDNKFIFTAIPLPLALNEVERQYDINITIDIAQPDELIYSGYFTKTGSVNTTLDLICQGMGISFVKQGENAYIVSQAD